MTRKPWLGILAVAILLGGMALLNSRPAEVEGVRRIEVKPLSTNLYQLSWELGFYNPNLLSCTFESIDLTVFKQHEEIGQVIQTLAVGIPARKSTYFPMSVRITKEQLDYLGISDTTEFNFSGHAMFSSFGSKKTVNINTTEKITPAHSL